MLTVATLLRSGGEFQPEHVNRLRKQCKKAMPPHRFVCLSDVSVPCERIPLVHDWMRWWGQCELFRPGLFDGPVLYMDLDTTVLRDPGIVAKRREFWALYFPHRGKPAPTSGIMAWNGDFSVIYEKAKVLDKRFNRWVNEGIFPYVKAREIQAKFPGFYSFKRDIVGKPMPADTRVVYWHGHPRPWDIKELKL